MKDASKEYSPRLIKIKAFNLSKQKIESNDVELSLELYEQYVRYRGEYDSIEFKNDDDEMLGTKNIYNYFDFIFSKENISAIESYWNHHEDCWCIRICINGSPSDLTLFFKRGDSCKEIFEILFQYKYADNNTLQKSL